MKAGDILSQASSTFSDRLQTGPLLTLRLHELVTFVMTARLPGDALCGPIQVSGVSLVSLDIFPCKTALRSHQLQG